MSLDRTLQRKNTVQKGENGGLKNIVQLFQSPGSRVCGQTCVAMALGITIAEAIRLVGRRGGTKGSDLLRGIQAGGGTAIAHKIFRGRSRIRREELMLPTRCIARIRYQGDACAHWILVWNGHIYDPYPEPRPWKYEVSVFRD